LVCSGGTAIVVHPSVPVSSLDDLIRLARAQPGKLSYGTSGIAGAGHMAAELLQIAAQMKMVHVAYKGGAPAMTDLLGGHIPLLFASMGTAVPYIKSGKIKALASPPAAACLPYRTCRRSRSSAFRDSRRWSGSRSSGRRSCRRRWSRS